MVPPPERAEAALLSFLDRIGVAWRLSRHAPLFTVEDSKQATAHLPGAHTKNMFLKAKKGGYFLVTCLEDRRIRIKHLEKAIGARRLSFGAPDALAEILGVIPGAVTPFAAFNDREAQRVRVVLDAQMMQMDPQNYHPLHNAATLTVGRDALPAFFAATGHSPEIVDFDALEALAEAENAA